MRNKIFIATSFDGYIADENGGIDWLTEMPTPNGGDGGFSEFMTSVDAVVMGRNTFEKVLSFGIDWPYSKKVFVWSSRLKHLPSSLETKVEIINGSVGDVLKTINTKGYKTLYIDGGQTVQSFLNEGLIHEIVVTQAPILLGKGIPLFKNVKRTPLHHIGTEVFDNGMIQAHYEIQT